MKILNVEILKEYADSHKGAANQFWAWYYDVCEQDWSMPLDIREKYATADPIPNNRAVFDIRGKKYRIIVQINYQKSLVYIRWIGTHAEYNKIDATII